MQVLHTDYKQYEPGETLVVYNEKLIRLVKIEYVRWMACFVCRLLG